MRASFVLLIVLLMAVSTARAQTETPTIMPPQTETPAPYSYSTLPPQQGTPPGVMTRFDYTVSVGETHIANLLTWLLYSLWGMFLFLVLVMMRRGKN
jgi:hypothetical protein